MKLWEVKVRNYHGVGQYDHGKYVDVKVWKLFGIVIWRKRLD